VAINRAQAQALYEAVKLLGYDMAGRIQSGRHPESGVELKRVTKAGFEKFCKIDILFANSGVAKFPSGKPL